MDDTTPARGGGWTPWSHRPYCDIPEGNPDVEYCIYTSTAYRGNQGISIIATPELAASIVDILDDSVVPAEARDHITSPLTPRYEEDVAFEIRDLPDRGKGGVAKRKISKWEVIMVGFPVILAKMDFLEILSRDQADEFLRRAIEQLPEEQQDLILDLAQSTGRVPIIDILQTNIFGVEVNDTLHMALFTEGSRINHNCRPNSYWRYNQQSMAMEVVAMRDIEPGEEITHSYAALGMTHDERQEQLKLWGFTCKCALCSSSPGLIVRADRRRERLFALHKALIDYENLDEAEVGKMGDEMLKIVEEEDLWPKIVVYYEVIARAWLHVGRFKRAKKYATMASEAWTQFLGEDHENEEGMRKLHEEVDAKTEAAMSK